MARKPSALPKIPVKTERVTKRLQFDPTLIKRVEAFCDFYAQNVGAKPDWNDAAVALIEHALDGNRDFAKYVAEQGKP
ncbi:hypothetical protein [Xanthomonas albilineans]|uniref:hypothetical protein n=1 Tax=Xanthomonas albilineans TaxID=29447 RepID=UPI0005F3294C|nr:hypothetical protein [Xanthomonas albilineans]